MKQCEPACETRTRVVVLLALLSCTSAATSRAQVGAPANPPLLNPNLAKPDELAEVTDLSPEVAKLLIEKRPFLRTADFDKFLVEQKLTPEQRTAVYGRMFLHINLNEATQEEMTLIPGMGDRMIHEFEEYRPYKTLAQFRREIGKYVDAKELIRLEQYVFVPINLNTASDEDMMSIPGMGGACCTNSRSIDRTARWSNSVARSANTSTPRSLRGWKST